MMKLFPSSGCLQRLFCCGSNNPWNPFKGRLLLVCSLSSSILNYKQQSILGRRTARNRVLSYSPWTPMGSLLRRRFCSHNNIHEDEDENGNGGTGGVSSRSSQTPCLVHSYSCHSLQITKLVPVSGQKIVTLKCEEDVVPWEFLGSSSPGWVAFVKIAEGEITLVNPFTEKTPPVIVRLPPAASMPGMDLIIEMWRENYDHVEYYDFIRNIVWSSSPMSADCTVMVVYRPYNNFAFCRPGDKSWSCASGSRSYTQLAYSNKNKLFYARDLVGGAIEAWDLQESSCPKRIHRLDHLRDSQPSNDEILEYLVESLGDILLVVRYILLRTRLPSKTHRFDVFKLDFQQQRAERVECIGDRVLFLGPQQSFSVSALDFPELKPNSIYFPHYEREPVPREQEPFLTWEPWEYDIGLYCLEDHSITPGPLTWRMVITSQAIGSSRSLHLI